MLIESATAGRSPSPRRGDSSVGRGAVGGGRDGCARFPWPESAGALVGPESDALRGGGAAEGADADPAIRQFIDEQILEAAPALVEEHRAKFGRFIEDQILSWQEEKLVAELERHIGPDLQYIRINGTVVGAAAGLAIAVLTQLLR